MKTFLKIAGAVATGILVGDLTESFIISGFKTLKRKMEAKTNELRAREKEDRCRTAYKDYAEKRMGFGETYMQ